MYVTRVSSAVKESDGRRQNFAATTARNQLSPPARSPARKLPINMEGATEKSFIRLKALGNCT